jgi:hypothetical protein
MQRRVVAATVAVMALVATACGGGGGGSKSSSSAATGATTGTSASAPSGGNSGTPAKKISDALGSLGKGGGTLTFSLYGSAADFDALSTTPSTQKDDAIANKLIPNSSVALSFGGSRSGNFDLDITIGGENDAVNMLVTGGTLYLKIDVKGIGAATGANTSKITGEAGAISSELPFVGTLLAGNYVSLNLKQAGAMAKQFGAGAHPPVGASGETGTTITVSQEKQLIQALRSALTSGTTITKVGSDSIGEHYQIVAMPQTLAQAFYSAAASVAGPLSSEITKAQGDLSKISNNPVTVDAWISGGKLAQIEVDFRQFHKGAGGPTNPVGLKIDFSSSTASFSAPSGATPVDLTKLGSLFGGLLKGGAGSQ